MADTSKEELRKEINAILKDADLAATSAKKVREQLEEKLGESLAHRKSDIRDLVKEYVDSREEGSEESQSDEEGSDEEEENNKKKPVKRPAPPAKKQNAKKSKGDSSSEEEESEPEEGSNESDDDSYPPKKPIPKKKAPPKRKGKGSDSDSDSDWGKGGGGGGGKARKTPAAGRGKGGKGYTRAYKLSPQLASLMGKESMARHEVVKKMWALIKERNLYDPNNKQFAICDEDLFKVIGTKRFRTFGMMKYLKSHFRD